MSTITGAGRDLDAAVAAEVMGATWMDSSDPQYQLLRFTRDDNTLAVRDRATGRIVHHGEPWDDEYLPYYSADLAAAWRVVERMRERWSSEPNALRGEPDVWQFHDFADEGWRASVIWLHHDGPIVEVDEVAPTLPLAICRAALAAVRKPF